MLGRKAAVGYYKLIEKLKSVIQCSGGEVHKSSTSDLCVFTTVYTEILLSYLGGGGRKNNDYKIPHLLKYLAF